MPDRIVVAGQFELLANLGRGGMGSVYLARYAGQCLVAVKLLGRPPEGVSVQESNERFNRECDVLMSLRHPAIVRAYAHGLTGDGTRYLVMDYVDGVTLSEIRRENGGPLSPPEAARLLLPLADALCYCHSRRIFHRDITPHNILVADDGTGQRHAKLVDFGASWLDDSQDLTRGVILGNLDFQPVERFSRDRSIDPETMGEACDIYGLAAMAYFLTAGRGPSGALLSADERMGHATISEGADEAWSALLAWALHHDRTRRIDNMALFRSVLQSWAEDDGEAADTRPFWDVPDGDQLENRVTQPLRLEGTLDPDEAEAVTAIAATGRRSWVDDLQSLPSQRVISDANLHASRPSRPTRATSLQSIELPPPARPLLWLPVSLAIVLASFVLGMTAAEWLAPADAATPEIACPDGQCGRM
jgi:serine/threonine protein kinase